MPAKAPKETKVPKEAKETKAPKAAKAKSGKAEPASAGGQKPNALQKPLQPSKELAAVVGAEPLPRGEVVSKVWDYIKKHDLQNPENRREILADAKLEAVFGKKKVTMFEMNKYLAQHLTPPEAG
jgi:chromatin remodeling complex protein RSC6